ncbi:Slp family lipoprotein [Candidatus Nitrospira salsa]
MRGSCLWCTILLTVLIGYSGCAESVHQIQRDPIRAGVPSQLEEEIDQSLTFGELKAAPTSFKGKVMRIGGIVLRAKRTKNGTEIEVLQLPFAALSAYEEDRTNSEGRFLAVQKSFLDPATVERGSRILVIGEVMGDVTKPLDEIDYTYPLLEIKHLVLLDDSVASNFQYGSYYGPGFYYAPYWGGPYYWGSPYGYGGYYSYYPRGGFYRRVPRRSPAPSQPAPQNIPPQFKKNK